MATALPSLRHFTIDAEHPPGDAPAAGFSDEDAERVQALSEAAVSAAEETAKAEAKKADKEDKDKERSGKSR